MKLVRRFIIIFSQKEYKFSSFVLFRMQAVNSRDKASMIKVPMTRRMANPPNHFPKGALEGYHQPPLELALGVHLSCSRHIPSQGEKSLPTDVA